MAIWELAQGRIRGTLKGKCRCIGAYLAGILEYELRDFDSFSNLRDSFSNLK